MCLSEKGDSKVFKKCYLKKFDGNTGEAVEHEEKLCDEVETVREFMYLGDRVSVGERFVAAVTART